MTDSGVLTRERHSQSQVGGRNPIDMGARRGSPARGENGCTYCGAELLA